MLDKININVVWLRYLYEVFPLKVKDLDRVKTKKNSLSK